MPPKGKKAVVKVAAAAARKVASSPSASAAPLWQTLDDGEAPKKRKKAETFKAESKLEFSTWKALKANVRIPGLNPEQIRHLVNADGTELFQKMLDDRMATERGDKDAPKYTPKYYEKLVEMFGPSEAPSKQLKVVDPREPLDEELINSLTEIQSTPKSYERVRIFLGEGPALNQRSFVLLSHQLLKTNPNLDTDSCNFCVAALQYISKHSLQARFPAVWVHLKKHLDEALAASYSFAKTVRKPLDLWWDHKRTFVGDVIDVPKVDECMKITKDFKAVEQDLYVIVQSVLGMRMFGPALKDLQKTKIVDMMKLSVRVLMQSDVTPATMQADVYRFMQGLERGCQGQARGNDCTGLLP
jgi:hypothetical protein